MSYDPELPTGFQDADIEQAEMEAIGRQIHAIRQAGGCAHQSAVGHHEPPIYPEQEGLKPGQVRCTDGCGETFESDEDWHDAMQEAIA